ncbi:MAG: WD40 repeat domain-containing protein, partial [Planctomycetaceae bacterium]
NTECTVTSAAGRTKKWSHRGELLMQATGSRDFIAMAFVGTQLVAATTDGQVLLLDAGTLTVSGQFELEAPARSLIALADGTIAIVTAAGVEVREMPGQLVGTIPNRAEDALIIHADLDELTGEALTVRERAVKILGDGNWDAMALIEGRSELVLVNAVRVTLFDSKTLVEKRSFPRVASPVRAIAVNQDGSQLAVASRSSAIQIFDLATGKETELSRNAVGQVRDVAFLADGSTLLGVTANDFLLRTQVTDTPTTEVIATAMSEGGPRNLFWVTASPDVSSPFFEVGGYGRGGRTLQNGDKFEVHGRNPYEPLHIGNVGGPSESGAWSPNAKWRFVGAHIGQFTVEDPRTGEQHTDFSMGISLCSAAFSPDSNELAMANEHGGLLVISRKQDGQSPWGRVERDGRAIRGGSKKITTTKIAWSPDGRWIVSVRDRVPVLLDSKTLEPVARLWGPRLVYRENAAAFAAAFRPDGEVLAAAASDGSVSFWDMSTMPPTQARETIQFWWGGMINSLKYTPDGRHLLTANGNGTIYVLRLAEPAHR